MAGGVFQYLKKRPAVPKCPMTGVKLKGIKPSRPADRKRLSLRHKKVFRAYGGKIFMVIKGMASCKSFDFFVVLQVYFDF